MSDALDTITKFINSPPGQLAAGGVLAGIVWKFFERVEAVLNEKTKLEIAVWLCGRKPIGPTVEPWAGTFARILDRVFGHRIFGCRSLMRSAICTWIIVIIVYALDMAQSGGRYVPLSGGRHYFSWRLLYRELPSPLLGNVLPDYCSVIICRLLLKLTRASRLNWLLIPGILSLLYVNYLNSTWSLYITYWIDVQLFRVPWVLAMDISKVASNASIVAACFTSIWLWLYFGSGFLLKAARRFDIGFEWFNRHFDIEKKPLQSIGLVARALVAVVYWTVVFVSRVV